MEKESASIRGGRIAMGANTIGLKFLKDQGSVWEQWVPADTAALVNEALAADKVNLCRAFEFHEGIQRSRVCLDDPRKAICVRCS